MMVANIILGLVLGGTYALIALGLTLQYGVSRIMNLAYGEVLVTASFAAYILFAGLGLNPVLMMGVILPAGFLVSLAIYEVMMRPLVARSSNRGQLEVDSILATFGLLFVIQGILLVIFGPDYAGYSYLDISIDILGIPVAANRLLALVTAMVIGGGLFGVIRYTRWGLTLRAVACQPQNAQLVGIAVNKMARLTFAVGGGLAASGGVVISMYQTFTATSGVEFTMKALIIVIMGGVGNVMGALLAGLMLGLTETMVSAYADPGLALAATYAIFLTVLLCRPAGLFGKA